MLPPFNYLGPILDVIKITTRQVNNYTAAIQASGVKNAVHLSSIGSNLNKGIGVLVFSRLSEAIFKELAKKMNSCLL